MCSTRVFPNSSASWRLSGTEDSLVDVGTSLGLRTPRASPSLLWVWIHPETQLSSPYSSTTERFRHSHGRSQRYEYLSYLCNWVHAALIWYFTILLFSSSIGLHHRMAQDPLRCVPGPRHPFCQLPACRWEAHGVRGFTYRFERRDLDREGGGLVQDYTHRSPMDGDDLRPRECGEGDLRWVTRKIKDFVTDRRELLQNTPIVQIINSTNKWKAKTLLNFSYIDVVDEALNVERIWHKRKKHFFTAPVCHCSIKHEEAGYP